MLSKQLELINEQTSPLFRIMSVYNSDQPSYRQFDNNISAFHIGKGLILSVAHNLRTEAFIFKSINNEVFTSELLPKLTTEQAKLFQKCYPLDRQSNMRFIGSNDQNEIQKLVSILKQINFDTRWVTLTERAYCRSFLVVQFQNDHFYNDPELLKYFNHNTHFSEPAINKHTYLVEVELLEAYYKEDIALYRVVNTHQDVISKMPSIEPDFSVLPDGHESYYCLQSSPGSFLGRLLNKASIEGHIDHHGFFSDRFEGNYTFEGLRYLIKGYFRFGSSGAPYVFFDKKSNKFKVNAIQSEASPIQLSINNNKEGNFQYVNAIASPLRIIESRIKKYL